MEPDDLINQNVDGDSQANLQQKETIPTGSGNTVDISEIVTENTQLTENSVSTQAVLSSEPVKEVPIISQPQVQNSQPELEASNIPQPDPTPPVLQAQEPISNEVPVSDNNAFNQSQEPQTQGTWQVASPQTNSWQGVTQAANLQSPEANNISQVSSSQFENNFVQSNYAPQDRISSQPNLKKILFISLGGFAGLLLISLLGFFGYKLYVASSDGRILSAAAKNIVNGKNMEVSFRAGASGFSVDGKLYVDKDQDLKFKLNNDFFPLEAIYLKKKDTIYVKSVSSSFGGGTSDTDKNPKYFEGKNLSKAIEKYGLKDMGIDSLNPTKNYFSASNLKYFKRLENEKMNGTELYKFELVSSDSDIKKATDEANKKIKEFSKDTVIKKLKNKTTFWIKKSDNTLYKVEGETSLNMVLKEKDYSKCDYSSVSYTPCDYDNLPTKDNNQNINFNWQLDIKGGYKEDISLPKDAKIEDSVDLSNYKEEMEKSTYDTQKRGNMLTVQTALEAYYAKNRRYPSSLTQLVPDPLTSIPKNPDNEPIIYKPKNNNMGYSLSVKLTKPNTSIQSEKDGYYKIEM